MTVKLVHEYARVIALISDLHIGSRYAVCPENWETEEGTNLSKMANQGQKELLKHWNNFVKTCNELNVDTIFILGDVCAGVNPKECGLHMMTTDLNEQCKGAETLLEPLCKNRNVGVFSGSQYHESRDFRIHENIAKHLGGKFYGAIANIRLEPTDKIVNLAHRTTEALVYPETSLSRDIMFEKEAEALGKLYKTHAIVRGHRHSFVEIHKYDLHYVSLPCWQAFVPYEQAVRWYFKFQPDIGGVIMFVDMNGRLRFWHFLYPCPHIADKIVTA